MAVASEAWPVGRPNERFKLLASADRVGRAVAALTKHNIHAVVAKDREGVHREIQKLVPEGSEVFTSASRTLETLGLTELFDASGKYDSVRGKLKLLDPKTQMRQMIKLGATPQFIVGSVHAVTETGELLIASATGSQLGSYSAGAEKVIWVVGTQKIVTDLDEGMQRLRQYTYPLEDQRARQAYGFGSVVAKVLTIHQEARPGRSSLIFVEQDVGF